MNHNKELISEFWEEMSKAQEMTFGEAMKTYIPNTSINRKRFVSAMLEAMKVENTEDKYQQTYKNLEESGKFEEILAPTNHEERQNKRKQDKTKTQKGISQETSKARTRLAEKGIIPSTGKFGKGHKIQSPKNDFSKMKDYMDQTR